MDKRTGSPEALSARELEIAEDYAGGASYQQIARRLHIAPSTVRTHLATVYRKLGVSSKLALLDRLRTSNPRPQTGRAQMPDKPSIAVLAFDNMSDDPDQDYFSDGISEDIITALSRSPWLFVIARNSTFTYKGETVDARRVSDELGVRYVMEGSVRRSGDRIRVTAQLIDGLTGGHVWSERYDGQLADVFDLQDEITHKVVASVLTSVHLTASGPVERQNRPDLTVWELTMRAWHLLYEFDRGAYQTARTLVDRALELDPESAEATLVKSLLQHHSALLGFATDPEADAREAYELGRRAARLDERNEYAHWAHGISCVAQRKFDESIAALERAVELNPNCSVAYGSLGTSLGFVGRSDEAIRNQMVAIRSNPRDPSIFFRFSGMAMAHYMAGRWEDAAEWATRAVLRRPSWYFGHFILIAALFAANRRDEAAEAARQCLQSLPDVRVSHFGRVSLKDDATVARMCDALRKSGLPD